MRRLLAATAAVLLTMGMLSTPAQAGTGGNIGSAQKITGMTYDLNGALVDYTCASVHRTKVEGGYLERQSCRLAAGAPLPARMTEITYGPRSWASDYILRITDGKVWETAEWWTQSFAPSGTVQITSFYLAR